LFSDGLIVESRKGFKHPKLKEDPLCGRVKTIIKKY
jgi:hypothetical protein